MLGAIIGDMVGSLYDANNIKTKDFNPFNVQNRMTDDSILTIVVSEVLLKYFPFDLNEQTIALIQKDLSEEFSRVCRVAPRAGWGGAFYDWCRLPDFLRKPYYSYGNGAAMRISPVAWLAKDEEQLKLLTKIVTEITHDHPEGLKGAEAVAMAIYLALNGKSKEEIKTHICKHYYPRLSELDYDELVKNYKFDVTCQGSVPEAIYCFLISTSLKDAIKTAVSIGGDSDTIASITGAIAEAYYQKDSLSEFEEDFLYLFINLKLENDIKKFYKTSGHDKFAKKT